MLYYGIQVDIGGDNIRGVMVQQGDTPFPDGAIFPVAPELRSCFADALKVVDGVIVRRTIEEVAFSRLPIKYKKLVDDVWVEMTSEEKAVVDQLEEEARQAGKTDIVKEAENNFLLLCETLTGSKVKASFDSLNELLTAMLGSNPQQAMVLGLRLLALDAELKREAGLRWWDDCAWHPEVAG